MNFEVRPAGVVPQEALDYFDAKALAPDLDLDEVWGEEHDLAFAVAGVMGRDLLEGLREAVRRAIAEGLTYEEFTRDDNLDRVLDALGWWVVDEEKKTAPHRLRVVYETNTRVARVAGQWARIQRTKAARPYIRYSLGPSEKHRPEHVAWDGTVLAVDDPWWATHTPPNGFGCKCRIRQLSTAEAEDLGVTDTPPGGAPDPGWERNPGERRLP